MDTWGLAFWDIVVIALFLTISLFIGLAFRKKAGKSLSDFFLSGRNLPWYIAGISMVATTFAADTPLLVTEIVRGDGISGNWLWWNMCIGGMLTTFFFAHLWRRAGVLTELEFLEFRYSGPVATFLRGFKSVYLGLFLNAVIIGWVNLAMMTILKIFFQIPDAHLPYYILGLMVITVLYSSVSGLYGVAFTDAFQFVLAMTGTTVLAILVVNSPEVGGISGLKDAVPTDALSFFPVISDSTEEAGSTLTTISLLAFISFIGVQWWASWYPGAEPGGGGYIAQRIMSAKNEKHAVFSSLLFNIAHYCLRPWPWILVALSTFVLYPQLSSPEEFREGYVMTILQFMPVGLKGLIFAAFLAAYMSTLSTQFNWGASFLVNDLYKRFAYRKTPKPESHYVTSARWATLLIMAVSFIITLNLSSIESAWKFILQCGSGLGLVLILRWYWWRISAVSEFVATLAPVVGYIILRYGFPHVGEMESFLLNAGFTTVCWLIATFIAAPEKPETLQRFYARVRPGGFWGKYGKNDVRPFTAMFTAWFISVLLVYTCLFFIGYLIFGNWPAAGICLAILLPCIFILNKLMKRIRF